jgi:hypothetical protein
MADTCISRIPGRIGLILIVATLLAPISVLAQIKAPGLIPNDHGAVSARTKDGAVRWTAEWTMEPWTVAGRRAVRFTESGRGLYSPFKERVQWSLESIWIADGSFFPLRFERTITDSKGTRLAVERKNFDQTKGTLRFERQGQTGAAEIKDLAAPSDSLAIEGIAGILRFFPFGENRSLKAHLLTNEPEMYDVTLEPRGTERLRTPGGDLDCFKIEVVPHLGLLNILKPFFPKTYFWFTVTAPHLWVRYEGFENGRGTPEIIMEAR